MFKYLWPFHGRAIEICRANMHWFPKDFIMPGYSEASDIHRMNDNEKMVVLTAFVLSLGITDRSSISDEVATKICLGVIVPVYSLVPIEGFNQHVGHQLGVLISDDLRRPLLYLIDLQKSIKVALSVWNQRKPFMKPTFLKTVSRRDERWGLVPSQTNWYVNLVASPSPDMEQLFWISSESAGFHCEHTKDGVYCLTLGGGPIQKGIRHIEEAAISASTGVEVEFWHGLHLMEAQKAFKKVVSNGSAEMVPSPDVYYSISRPAKPRIQSKAISDVIQSALSDAMQLGAAVIAYEYVVDGNINIRQLRYKVGQNIRVIKSERTGEFWFVNRDAINDLQRAIDNEVMMGLGSGKVSIDYSKFFGGLAPPFGASTFVSSMTGDLEMVFNGNILEISEHVEKQQDIKGRSLRSAVLMAANMAIANCRQQEVECSINKLGNARVYIHMAIGSGKVKTRYEAGRLIITPILK